MDAREQEADLGWALGTLLRGYLTRAEDVLDGLPGGPRGFRVLSIAGSGSCSNQAAIAEATGLDRTVLTYLIDDLEKAGLVVRTPDPNDRRSRRITLTDAGTTRFAELDARMKEVERQLLAGLPSADASALRALAARAAYALGEDPVGVCDTVDQIAADAGQA